MAEEVAEELLQRQLAEQVEEVAEADSFAQVGEEVVYWPELEAAEEAEEALDCSRLRGFQLSCDREGHFSCWPVRIWTHKWLEQRILADRDTEPPGQSELAIR